MDYEILLNLFKIPAMTGDEESVRNYIISILEIYDIEYETDVVGNVYNISNKEVPLLCAHMDTVQDYKDYVMKDYIRIYKDNILKGAGTIGADDKCGIYTILDLLMNGEKINFLFTVQEEMGGMGSDYFMSKNDISDLPYGLVIDRYGSSDILCVQNDYGTKEFEYALEKVGEDFGFYPARGVWCDADNLNEQISCANLSCGYYGHHTKKEYVVLSELKNTIYFIHHVIKNITDNFKAPTPFKYSKGGYYSYDNYKYNYDDFTWDDVADLDALEVFEKSNSSAGLVKCENCHGYTHTTEYIQTLKKFLCPDCIRDLSWELEYIQLNLDLEESYSGR